MGRRKNKSSKNSPPAKSNSKYIWTFGVILILSLLANVYYLGKTDSIRGASEVRSSYPNFLSANEDFNCDNKDLDEESLPLCPESKKLTFLPRTYPTHSIFIGYEENLDHLALIQQTVQIATRMDPPVPVIVMVPKGKMEAAESDLKPLFSSRYKKHIRLLSTPSKYTVWSQDYFEIALGKDRNDLNIVDLPYESQIGEHIPPAVALACRANLISQSEQPEKSKRQLSGNYGGNIEPLSDHVLLVGNTMSEAQRKVLANLTEQKVIEIDVSWLQVGHVDEVISVLPVKNRGGSCPFDLMYASPGLALHVLSSVSKDARREEMIFRYGFGEKKTLFNVWDCFDKTHPPKGCRALLEANRAYEQLMQKNMDKIRASLINEDSCKKVEFKPIPMLFTSSEEHSKFGTNLDRALSIDPNPLNNVLIGNHILVPRQNIGVFFQRTKAAFEDYDLQVSYVEGSYVHFFGGGIHCSMNIRRTCRKN